MAEAIPGMKGLGAGEAAGPFASRYHPLSGQPWKEPGGAVGSGCC